MKNTPFKLKSGNITSFKNMGSSPAKKAGIFEGEGEDRVRISKTEAAKKEAKGVKITRTAKDNPNKAEGKEQIKKLGKNLANYDKNLQISKNTGHYKDETLLGWDSEGNVTTTKDVEKNIREKEKSPAKQVGGDAGEAIYHWKKYKAAKAQDAAVNRLATNKNISRKAFDTKLAKITKTVDPHPKHHHKITKGPEAMRPPKGAIVKKGVKNVAKKALKVGGRLAGPIGAGLLAYDVLKTGVKRVAKGIKTGVPQTKLKGDWKRAPKKKYTGKKSSPAKQISGDTGEKKIMQERGLFSGKKIFTKGARTKGSDVTVERGKKTTYVPQGDKYAKVVQKKKKGSKPGSSTWETKKIKEIPAKRAKRQIKRKSKRYTKI